MNRAQKKSRTIDEYIAEFPEPVAAKLQELRQLIKTEVPGATETIRYGMPTFLVNDTYLIYFAAWKHHIAIYPFSAAMEASIPEAKMYKMSGKGTIQFPLKEELPISLIQKIIQFLLKENISTTLSRKE